MLKVASFCLFVGLPFVRADGWDDFSNNLATDLAPFLSLFGERVTMQYLSESITMLDYFIFSMAPMEILTAVVSVIRVCGSPSLRAFIGRAQEGGGNAEAELCSSTSRDVCELYNNGGITRVFGRPKILEVVHDPTGPDFSKKAGLYTFQEYTAINQGKKVWREGSTKLHGDLEPDGDGKQPRNVEAGLDQFAPNLSLNVGIKRNPKIVFWAVAIAGAVLQAGVMIFAAAVTYYLRWETEGSEADGYACPLAITGTALVCGGIFYCAYLVGSSTKERVFRRMPNDSKGMPPKGESRSTQSSIYWVQPGDQVLGDQTFDPFCFSDRDEPLQEHLISWKNRSDKSERAAWVAAGATICGFVLQFVGLRGMHAAVSVAQLGAILVMSAARASLRMQRLKPKDNFFVNFPDEVVGHELDWLALRIGREDIQSDLDSTPSTSPPSSPAPPPPRPLTTNPSGSSFERRYYWKFCGVPNNSLKREAPSPSGWTANAATKLLAYRARLADLTESLKGSPGQVASARNFNMEMVKVRLEAQKLAASVVSAINTIYSNNSWTKKGAGEGSLWWEINCSVSSITVARDPSSKDPEYAAPTQRQHAVHLKFRRTVGYPWQLENPLELEALLGLWVWSLISDPTMETQDTYSHLTKSRATEIATRRIVSTAEYVESIRVWLGDANPGLQESTLGLETEGGRPADVFIHNQSKPGTHTYKYNLSGLGQSSGFDYALLKTRLSNDLGPRHLATAARFFGWHNMDLAQTQDSQPTTKPIRIFSADTDCSLLSSCAHEIFGYFIKAILDSGYAQELGDIVIEQDRRGFRLDNSFVAELTKSFTESRLGSRTEALLCILPSVIARLQLPSAKSCLEAASNTAKEHRKRKEWKDAELVLKWAWEICRNSESQGGEELVEDRTSRATIALGELYRWALMDETARNFGSNGISWLLGQKELLSEACCEVIDRYDTIRRYFDNEDDNTEDDDTDDDTEDDYARYDLTTTLLRLTRRTSTMSRKAKGDTLIWAAKNGWTEVIRALLESATEPDFKDMDSRTAISYAAENGMVEATKELIRGGAFPDTGDNHGFTPMMFAIYYGHEAVVRLLLENDRVDINSTNHDGRTPLHIAIKEGHVAIAHLLVSSSKCDLHRETGIGYGPLSIAARYGHETVVKQVLDTGKVDLIKASSSENGPLQLAAGSGHAAVVRLLLETGKFDLDSSPRSEAPNWALSEAAEEGQEAMVQLLLESGTIDLDDDHWLPRALRKAAGNGHEGVVKLLLESGRLDLDGDAWSKAFKEALIEAVGWGHEGVVKLLLESGKVSLDGDISLEVYQTLLGAATKGREGVVKLLLESGKVSLGGWTPGALTRAAKCGYESVVKLLVKRGYVHVDVRETGGQTLLHIAAEKGVVKLLLETGKLNPDAVDNNGQTAMQLATKSKRTDVVKLLQDHGYQI